MTGQINIIGEPREITAKEAFQMSDANQKEKDAKTLAMIFDAIREAASDKNNPTTSVRYQISGTDFTPRIQNKLSALGYKFKIVTSISGVSEAIISWGHIDLNEEENSSGEENPNPDEDREELSPSEPDNGETETPVNPDEGIGTEDVTYSEEIVSE